VIHLLLSFSGYAWGVLHDIAALRGTPYAKPVCLVMSAAGHLTGLYGLMRHSSRWNPPLALRLLCFVLAPAGWAAMFYSVMVEIPFRKGWVERGHTPEIVTTGTYALTRHPGVFWFTIAVFASAVATRSKRLLLAAPILVAGDVAHVGFQERFILTSVFGTSYVRYQQRTPFVVPTPASLRRFVRTAVRPEDDPQSLDSIA
jgi:protein-S-isoprenylcysteine O-methyltransferase Ste14